jgi:cytochrome P450
LESGNKIPLLENSELTPAQNRALVFVTFFAGQETVASLINNTLYEIAKDPKQAQRLEEDTIDDFFVRSIHDFTPAYGTGRKVKNHLTLEYTLKGETTPKTVVFLKDTYLASRISAVAESIVLPEKGPLPKTLNWKPFGAGPHACPGRQLAKEEFEVFFDTLKSEYTITLDPDQVKPKRVGLISLQLTEDIYINIKKKAE